MAVDIGKPQNHKEMRNASSGTALIRSNRKKGPQGFPPIAIFVTFFIHVSWCFQLIGNRNVSMEDSTFIGDYN